MENTKTTEKELEKASAVYNMTKQLGWLVIEDFIKSRILNAESKIRYIDETKDKDTITNICVSSINQIKALESVLKKINEYIDIYNKGGQ